ncbi:leucine-rich repeat and WD repeat-containing protein 1-like isoform X2 [Ostrea edulis]|uniref:leucine-rich repeat and WD repeat-containing protein 1-like isoform X2 n=1 Tax=Ostrea edulis TaxID=37623 RepID=UPI0024AFA6F2|nr:leucine-rich repeat and WD repeat-containing protein 1-like isoform X2 [Ostrea edulis]
MKNEVKTLTLDLIGQVEGSQRLPTIKSLMLSDYSLEELPMGILKHMKNLKVLDLSRNKIKTFPDVTLKTLETLNVSENHLESVDFVRNLPNLKELVMEGNPSLHSKHKVEAVLKCPSLLKIDDDNVSYIHKQIQCMREKWQNQVQAKFEVLFEEKFTEKMTDDEFLHTVTEFKNTIKADALFASATSEAEKIIIDQVVQETSEDARSGKLFNSNHRAPGTPRSARLSRKLSCNSPRSPSAVATTPKRSRGPSQSSLLESPTIKMLKTPISPITTPNKRKRRRDSDEESVSKQDRKYSPVTWTMRKKSAVEHNLLSVPPLADYDPVYFLRCHSEKNDPADEITKVWKCAFEPRIEDPNKTTNMLATCGGQKVCLIDCNTGKVMKRYRDDNKYECFYTLAWTTVQLKNSKQEKTNLLAVAGGSSDRKIIMWDIGIPDMRDYNVLYKKLHVLQAPDTDALNLVLSMPSQTLLAGCEDSCYGWKADRLDKISKDPDYHFYLPKVSNDTESNASTDRETVDGLTALQNGNVGTKCVGDDIISIWNVKEQLLSKENQKTDRRKVKTIGVKPTALLHYTKQEVDYINVGATGGLMVVGDDSGNLRLYNVEELTNRKSRSCDDILQPSRILEWPEVKEGPVKPFCQKEAIIVNSACASHDEEYIACGTDNNLVCIWKKQQGSCEEEDMCS